MAEPPIQDKPGERFTKTVRTALLWVEDALYTIVGVLLLGSRAITNQLLELGLLGLLALAVAVAIYLVRRSGPPGYDPAGGTGVESSTETAPAA